MPTLRTVLAAGAVLVVVGTCIVLGFWQLGRYREREAANAGLRAALAAPPRELPAAAREAPPGPERWSVRGSFDAGRQVLLIGRSLDGMPGVHVITPLRRADGGPAVLVDRGFLPADDAASADPAPFDEPGERAVVGLVAPFERRVGDALWAPAAHSTAERRLWSARWLVADSLAAALPYAVAPFVLRELPADGVPAQPVRVGARFANTSTHLGYAGQWFFFGLIALVGPFILARARRRRADPT